MTVQTRAQLVRQQNAASTGLSDPAEEVRVQIQDGINEEHRTEQEVELPDHDVEIAGRSDDGLTHAPDWNVGSHLPRKATSVQDIEAELQLKSEQGQRLHHLVRNEMKNAGFLGKVSSDEWTKGVYQAQLDAVIATAKRGLYFLRKDNVSEERLDQLLITRARISNENEKHNERLVASGKVVTRLGSNATDLRGTTAGNREKQVQQEDVEVDGKSMSTRTQPATARIGSRSRRSTAGASVIEGRLTNAHLSDTSTCSLHDTDGNNQPHVAPPPFRTDMFTPTVFLIRVINSTTGAAVHTPSLIQNSRRGAVVVLEDINNNILAECQ